MGNETKFSQKDFDEMLELMNERLVKETYLKRLNERIREYEKRQSANYLQRCQDKLHG